MIALIRKHEISFVYFDKQNFDRSKKNRKYEFMTIRDQNIATRIVSQSLCTMKNKRHHIEKRNELIILHIHCLTKISNV